VRRYLAILLSVAAVAAATLVVATPTGAAGPGGYVTVRTGETACQLATVDVSTGHVAVLPAGASADACVDDLAVAPDGTVYGLRDVNVMSPALATLVVFDPASGAVTATHLFTGTFTQSFTAHGGIAVDRIGNLFASFTTDEPGCSDLTDTAIVCLYRVDPATGAATLVGNAGAQFDEVRMFFLAAGCGGSMVTADDRNTAPDSIPDADPAAVPDADPAADPATALADDSVDAQAVGLGVATVNQTTGAVTPAGAFVPNFDLVGLEYSRPDDVLYALGRSLVPAPTEVDGQATGVSIYTVDVASGTTTLVVALDSPRSDIENLALIGTCETAVSLAPDFAG
jgi:hypothetical protein